MLFEVIAGIWVVGMIGYIALDKFKRYNKVQYFDVSNELKKFKSVRDRVSGNEKGIFR